MNWSGGIGMMEVLVLIGIVWLLFWARKRWPED